MRTVSQGRTAGSRPAASARITPPLPPGMDCTVQVNIDSREFNYSVLFYILQMKELIYSLRILRKVLKHLECTKGVDFLVKLFGTNTRFIK